MLQALKLRLSFVSVRVTQLATYFKDPNSARAQMGNEFL